MPNDDPFAVFSQEGDGPMWRGRGFFNDLDAAKQKALACVDEEGLEVFVFSFQNYSEVARFYPTRAKAGCEAASSPWCKSTGWRPTILTVKG